MSEEIITKRLDGKYVQRLGDVWVAEYWEDPESGLWRADVFRNDVPKWASNSHLSIEEAERSVRNYLDQL